MQSTIPARLDRLTWSGWHRRIVIALGITWILDGLEASLIANLGPTLEDPRTLGLTPQTIGLVNTVYLVGQVVGALFFGHLTDRLGRKKLFLVTLTLYLAATALSGLSPYLWMFMVLRFLAGAGIGGEYSAINSAIDELIPARVRGQVDLTINGSYWIGVGLGGALTLVLLDPRVVPIQIGWRAAFGLGAVLGLAILLVRRDVPESPRWLLMHGFADEADVTMRGIERAVHGDKELPAAPAVEVKVIGTVGFAYVLRTLLVKYRRRTVLGLTLMLAQAFFYNAIFFSYALILQHFYGVAPAHVGLYIIPFAVGNFMGPLLLGRLFDRWGRRKMIALTYSLSGLLLLGTGALFVNGVLDATTQTIAWCVVFFFASAAASSAYLTVSELFPVEIRGMAIAIFYAVATCAGAFAPLLFGALVAAEDRSSLFWGYALAAGLMIAAAVIAFFIAEDAENKSLEELVPV